MSEFFIPGPLPGLNEMIGQAKGCGGRGARYARIKDRWTQTCALHALAAGLKPMARVRLGFRWVERNRQRNPDNIACAHKYILDGLVTAKVLANDGWSQVAGWSDSFEVGERPGVWVTLAAVGLPIAIG
jgi:hypothetical protein